jgi:hypothetical protein
VACQKFDVVLLGRLDHRLGFFEIQRHWLLDHDVLAVVRGQNRVLRMEAVGTGDPHGFQVRVLAHRFGRLVDARVGVALLEAGTRLRIDVGAGEQLQLGHRVHRRQHLRAADAHANHAHLERAQRSGSAAG